MPSGAGFCLRDSEADFVGVVGFSLGTGELDNVIETARTAADFAGGCKGVADGGGFEEGCTLAGVISTLESAVLGFRLFGPLARLLVMCVRPVPESSASATSALDRVEGIVDAKGADDRVVDVGGPLASSDARSGLKRPAIVSAFDT